MDSSKSRLYSSADFSRMKRLTGRFMDKPENDMIPSAPVQPLDSFNLSKSSFDFTMSQVLTPRPAVFTSGNMYFRPNLSQQTQKCASNNRKMVAMEDINECYEMKPELSTPAALLHSDAEGAGKSHKLRSVEEIPSAYRHIFKFPHFNILQSTVLDEVLYTDKSIVVSAPTGSGKTAVFEIALIRLLMKTDNAFSGKIIYMAPMKALCTERFQDWQEKFQTLKCLKVTGDSELDDVSYLNDVNLICTTPEKWDSMSRRWKDKKGFFHGIRLFLIDEIHSLNDVNRGATVEAVVSRMKTLQTASSHGDTSNSVRFIAVSATLPNYSDIAEWLSTPSTPAAAYNIEEKYRPVKLERFVIAYPFKKGSSDFRFDMNLSYRLRNIIDTYSHGKPTLVFCSSRKSVIQSAEILAKGVRMHSFLSHFNSALLQHAAQNVHEQKVMDLLSAGVGVHHAGLPMEDRQTIEELFRASKLPVLISTSTLAMGVNLPAHLVIIKSTHFYNMGTVEEYSDMQLLQMIGRAGRPQFDTSATAVIMTKAINKSRYESLVKGTQLVESSLHKNLIEHLNAEIVLQTITDMALAVEWMRHTFLYVRVLKNAKYYGLPVGLSKKEVEKRLQDLCLKDLNLLTGLGLVSVEEESYTIIPNETGRLMARYCIAFDTMKQFHKLGEHQESVADMLQVLSECAEFEDIQLRISEKRILNSLNKDKYKESIRFPLPGKIKTKQMKVNCLIQAQLSNLPVQDFSLSQDISKIFRVGQRVAKCLMELLFHLGEKYSLMLHSILVYKGLRTRLWFDSRLVSRQLDGIGPTMSLALANAGLNSFQRLEQAHPRDIELIVNRHPPFGNQIKESVSRLPRYELAIEQVSRHAPGRALLSFCIGLINRTILEDEGGVSGKGSSGAGHQSLLLVGDEDNNVVFKWRIMDGKILSGGPWTRTVEIKRALAGPKLSISLLSVEWVGLDIQTEYEPVYTSGWADLRGEGPASKLMDAMNKTKQNKAVASTTKDTSKTVKRSQASSNAENRNDKQAKLDSNHSAGKANILSGLLEDMEKTFPMNQSRITLQKFVYEKPKSLSHGKDTVNMSANVREQPVKQQQAYKEMYVGVNLTASSVKRDNGECNDTNFGNGNKDDDVYWSDEDFIYEDDLDLCMVEGRQTAENIPNALFQPFVDGSMVGGTSSFSAQKDRKSSLSLKRPMKLSLDTGERDLCQPKGYSVVGQRQALYGQGLGHNKSTLIDNSLPDRRKNAMFDSAKTDRLSERAMATSHTKAQRPNDFHLASTTPGNVLNKSNLALDSHNNNYDSAMNPLGKMPTNSNVASFIPGLALYPNDHGNRAVMGGDVDDFMRQQGFVDTGEQVTVCNPLPVTGEQVTVQSFACDRRASDVDERKVPSASLSDEELYQLAEEHELRHYGLGNDSCVQSIDEFPGPCDDIVQVDSSGSSPLPSPYCPTTTTTTTTTRPTNNNYHHHDDNRHLRNNDNSKPHNSNNLRYKTNKETDTPCDRCEDSYSYDEISWSPLSSQLSQQISLPIVSAIDNAKQMGIEGSDVAMSVHRARVVRNDDNIRNDPNSPRRYGLVQAWPRATRSQLSKATFGRQPELRGGEKSPKRMQSPKPSLVTSIFVPPHQNSPLETCYVPGKLFDGIFEGLM